MIRLFSSSPKAQQIFGTYGRNLGFLHYLFLTIIFLGVSLTNVKSLVPRFLKSMVAVGIFESIYAVFQPCGVDLVQWTGTQKWVFGTFGNPNYLSSFLALSAIAVLYLISTELRTKYKVFYFFILTDFNRLLL